MKHPELIVAVILVLIIMALSIASDDGAWTQCLTHHSTAVCHHELQY